MNHAAIAESDGIGQELGTSARKAARRKSFILYYFRRGFEMFTNKDDIGKKTTSPLSAIKPKNNFFED